MTRLTNSEVDDIVRSCLATYDNLPKSGKPTKDEWTVLAGVVQREEKEGKWTVVALGTGSWCASSGRLEPRGLLLYDAHAEVLARRALLLYLYRQLRSTATNGNSIFKRTDDGYALKEHVEFAFYSSRLPCGDAAIIPMNGDEDVVGAPLRSLKRPHVDNDIHRTGAKCLPGSIPDPLRAGPEYHILGRVRTKPGRGDPTLSVSCSDKLARWLQVGVQGALLHMLCGSIYIEHFIFGAGMPYSEDSLKRALLNRYCEAQVKMLPQFYQSSVPFLSNKTSVNVRPAPGSIIWVEGNESAEVAVQGRKLGLTKKKAILPRNSLCVSKYKLYEEFVEILGIDNDIKEKILKDSNIYNIPYNEMKRKSSKYLEEWRDIKMNFFKEWTVKPDMWDFCVEVSTPNSISETETCQ